MLDHRLQETVDNGKNGTLQESGFDAKTLESTLAAKTVESPLPPPKPQLQPTFFLQRLRQGWDNLNFRTKLSILLVGSAALPVIAVTQGLVALNRDNLLNDLKASLQKDGNAFTEDYVLWTQAEAQAQAQNLAKLVQTTEIDLSNPAQVSARRALLQNFLAFDNGLDSEVNKSFQIFTDAQGRTVAQDVKILDQGSYNNPPLQALDKALPAPKYSPVSLPTGISLGDIPIVKNSLRTGRPLSGMELLKPQPLQRLGLAKQADIGLRKQPTQNLPESKQPFPEGTYDIDGGQAGLTSMAVYPIKINNKLVGTVIVGALQNGNYGLVDKFSQKYNIPVATVFAKDWRVSTNVPYSDGQSRAIGTRVAREVAETVLNQKQDFSGQTNIVGQQYLTFYTPVYDHQKELNPSGAKPVGMAFVGESLLNVESSLRQQQLIAYSIGGGILLLVGLVTIPIAGSFARPLRRLAGFAQQVGAGEQGVRLGTTKRQDEIGILSKELNQMAVSIDASLIAQRQEAERAQLLKDIIVRISQSVSANDVFNKAVQEIRLALKTDRVVVYSFNKKWQGTVIAESVADEWPRALGAQIDDPCFADRYVERYRQGRVQPTANIYEAGLNDCHIKQLEQFAVKANLVAPILQGNQLLGLLIAHQCSSPRAWQQSEIDLFAQLATQVGFTLDRTNLIEQQKAGKEQLQKRALELLMEVDPVSRGDLTIRASVTEDEIGTVADSYNATIGSLRKIVAQVQTAALQVTTTTSSSEASAQELSAEALRQAEEISAALARIQEMSNSIRAVATNAEQAEAAVQQATQTVKAGDAAMNRTVEGILAIRETVAETSKKVKRLGESSQKISKVVNLIGTFADQTNLLALNASIEAAHAGEQGRGFAVVADRVRALARQSAQATAEIESLVKDIQTETNEVVAAMEAGTEQVVSGTKLVDETRQSLNQITAVSTQISTLVEAIAQASVAQSQASESVTQTMSDVAMSAAHTSTEATEVSASFKELLAVAQELQASASQFKVS